jgi:dihydrodipicolinate synthase/N-acetylneuraminate lyase
MKSDYITPAVTVFDQEGNLDHEGLRNLYDHLVRGGVSGILILGSIGEFFAIPFDRKKELIRLAARHIGGRTPLLVGTGGMDVNETIELSRYAFDQGADGVMVISPFYFGFSGKTVEEYYDHVAANCPGRLYLYNFPDRTGYDIPPQVALNLLRKHGNIVGCKDTLSGMDHTRELIRVTKEEFPDFKVYSGFDDNFAHNVLSGGAGCVAGLSNLAPEICSAWVKAFEVEDLGKVSEIQGRIDILMGIYQVGKPFVPYIKKAMAIRGIPIWDYCTFPLPRVTVQEADQLRQIMEQAGLL